MVSRPNLAFALVIRFAYHLVKVYVKFVSNSSDYETATKRK